MEEKIEKISYLGPNIMMPSFIPYLLIQSICDLLQECKFLWWWKNPIVYIPNKVCLDFQQSGFSDVEKFLLTIQELGMIRGCPRRRESAINDNWSLGRCFPSNQTQDFPLRLHSILYVLKMFLGRNFGKLMPRIIPKMRSFSILDFLEVVFLYLMVSLQAIF